MSVALLLFADDSPLKTPPQAPKTSREYFAKILNPQISQAEPLPAPPPVAQEVRLRTHRESERARHSSARSSGSAERHSAKLVGSLLASSGAQVTAVANDRLVTGWELGMWLMCGVRRMERRERPDSQKQQSSLERPEPAVQAPEPNMSTHSLPQSARPPPASLPAPSNSSVDSSPSRFYANAPFEKPAKQQVRLFTADNVFNAKLLELHTLLRHAF